MRDAHPQSESTLSVQINGDENVVWMDQFNTYMRKCLNLVPWFEIFAEKIEGNSLSLIQESHIVLISGLI